MMKAYPKYKDSGVEWLGEIPIDWKVKKLKYICDLQTGDQDTVNANPDAEYDFFVRAQKIHKIASYSHDCEAVLTAGDGVGVGKVYHYTKGKFNFHQRVYMMNNFKEISGRYFYYYLRTLFARVALDGGAKSTVDSLRMPTFTNFHFSYPNITEQKKLVEYLNQETNRIDLLISEKENFIKLLQEKRQVLISHVVTKGLDNNATMKSSRIEWIGDIPEHWGFTKLRYLGVCQNGINIGGECFGSGYPFISYGDVYKNSSLPKKVKGLVQSTIKDRQLYSIKVGDVLFTRTSETIEEIGFTSVCHLNMKDAVFAGFLIRFRPKENVLDAEFSEYYFQNEKLRAFFVKEMNLVTRASLSQELLKKMPVPIPPLHEQKKIAAYISNKTNKTNLLIDETIKSIVLLKEHRTALISAAVTGKIDIRDVA